MLAAEPLLAALRRHWPLARSVRNVRAISGGASQEIWALDLETPDGMQALILRRTRQWSDAAQAGSAGMAVEAALLSLAISHGVPAPQPMGNLAPQDGLGDGYFMMRVDGETSPRKILTEPRFAAVRTTLASECGALMARIHALPLTELPANLQLREGRAEQERAHWLAAHRNNGTARPVFELAFRWLQDHPLRDDGASVLVHGDFRNGNLVIGCEGVKAVLDWELAHRGDAMEDLGWFCVNSWRFGHSHLAAGGLGTREQLFQGYGAQVGCMVDPARVRWWQVLGTLKWGVTCDAMGLAWRNGSDPQIDRLAVARRVSETEADLMHLITPGGIA